LPAWFGIISVCGEAEHWTEAGVVAFCRIDRSYENLSLVLVLNAYWEFFFLNIGLVV
jgi:hypothetical protein